MMKHTSQNRSSLWKTLFVLLALVLMTNSVSAKKCRALTMSGAGALGAYQAAVFVGLVNNMAAEDIAYDVVTGVSAGSLNALGLSGFDPMDVEAGSNFIYGLWSSIPMDKAFDTWPGGILAGFFHKGLFDLDPGRAWVTREYGSQTPQKKITFSVMNANTGQYINFDYDKTDVLPDDFIDSAFASSSIPGVFPHITRGNDELVDGGTVWNIDIESPIRRCKEIVENESDIILDIFLVSAAHITEEPDFSGYSALDHFFRGQDIFSFYNGMNDYNSSLLNFPDVEIRHVIYPSQKLSHSPLDIISFTQPVMDR